MLLQRLENKIRTRWENAGRIREGVAIVESLTKNRQDKQTLERMVAKFFAPSVILNIEELTEGYFNVAYKICLSDKRKVILKVAPSKETRIMTYEKNIMESEVGAMNMVEKVHGIPVPKVLGFDGSC